MSAPMRSARAASRVIGAVATRRSFLFVAGLVAAVAVLAAPVPHAHAATRLASGRAVSPAERMFAAANGAVGLDDNDADARYYFSFVIFPERSHFQLIKGIAEVLLRRGHRVSFVINEDRSHWIAEADFFDLGAEFIPVRMVNQYPEFWANWSRYPMYSTGSNLLGVKNLYNIGQDYTTAVLPVFRRDPPDLVVGDQSHLTTYDVRDGLGIPIVVNQFFSTLERYQETLGWAPTFVYANDKNLLSELTLWNRLMGWGFRNVFLPLGNVFLMTPMLAVHRMSLGLPLHPSPFVHTMMHAPEDVPILVTSPAHGWLVSRPYSTLYHFAGPCSNMSADLEQTAALMTPELQTWLDSDPERPIIYVSTGTLVRLSEAKLSAMASALNSTDWRVLWSMRESQREEFSLDYSLPRDIFRFETFVPQLHVLQHPNVRAFFTHGGMSSVHEALHFHVPLVCMGFIGDQLPNCAAVEERGIGLRQLFDDVTAESLRPKIHAVMDASSEQYDGFVRGIQKLNKINKLLGGAERAADFLLLTADIGYAHLIPAVYDVGFLQRWSLDVAAVLLGSAYAVFWLVRTSLAVRKHGASALPWVSAPEPIQSPIPPISKGVPCLAIRTSLVPLRVGGKSA